MTTPYTISNKKITFDLNGKNLVFTGGFLHIYSTSYVDYMGSGKFEVNYTVTGTRSSLFCALAISENSTIKLTDITITDIGTETSCDVCGVSCDGGSTMVVDGNISAISNGKSGSQSFGISATGNDSTVIVNGNIKAANNGAGVYVDSKATVTVNGTITADAAYVRVDLTDKSETDNTTPTTKPGYLTYTDGESSVWVKAPGATISPRAATFDKSSGGDITLTVDTVGYIPQNIKNGAYTLKAGTDFAIVDSSTALLKAAYLKTLDPGTYTLTFNFSGGASPALTLTVTGEAGSVAPTITGPAAMTLNTGYAVTSTGEFTVTGTPAPTMTKTSGDGKITWNNTTKKLDIAAGLVAGTYPVVLTATSGANTVKFTFTLTVADTAGAMSNFKKTRTYTPTMFSDVNENAWYGFYQQKAVANAYEYGLMQGNSATIFNPAGNMTIAEAITVAARVHRIYSSGADDLVQSGSPWYKVYTDYAIDKEIITATDFSDYNRAATRAEMAYIFSGALPAAEFKEQNTVTTLPDVKNTTPYYNAIIMLYKAGVVAGSDDKGTFNPGNNIIRAEAAAIISRVILPDARFSGKTFE
jgi:hypothetical protein